MGCAPSSAGGNSIKLGQNIKKTAHKDSSDSGEFNATLRHLLKVHPPVQIDIGSGVRAPQDDQQQTVIFIFGGPGSLKGILTQDLAQEFEFVTISVEDVVFSYLPSKVANTVSSTMEMQELLKRDPKIVNLKWILQMISAKLGTSTSQRFIIDIVPELSSLLRSEAFTARNHDQLLEEFDRKHQVLFALHLYMAEERQLLEGKNSNGTANATKSADRNIELGEMSAEMSAFIKGVDEADKGRLERRLESFHSASESFLDYFRKTKRVVRLDLKVPSNEELMPTASRMLVDFGFGRNNDSIRVVLFVAGDYQVEDIDLAYYRLRKIRLSEVSHDKEETLSQQIRAVRKFIYRTAQPNENIIVIMKGINNTDYPPSKRINFLEYHSTYLDFFIRNREKRSPRCRCKMSFRFRAVSREGDEDVVMNFCLFHLGQSHYKNHAEKKLCQLYADVEVKASMRSFITLACLPVSKVEKGFYQMVAAIKTKNIKLMLKKTYVRRFDKENKPIDALYPINVWNCYDLPPKKKPRTENAHEGWHLRFNMRFPKANMRLSHFKNRILIYGG